VRILTRSDLVRTLWTLPNDARDAGALGTDAREMTVEAVTARGVCDVGTPSGTHSSLRSFALSIQTHVFNVFTHTEYSQQNNVGSRGHKLAAYRLTHQAA